MNGPLWSHYKLHRIKSQMRFLPLKTSLTQSFRDRKNPSKSHDVNCNLVHLSGERIYMLQFFKNADITTSFLPTASQSCFPPTLISMKVPQVTKLLFFKTSFYLFFHVSITTALSHLSVPHQSHQRKFVNELCQMTTLK